MNPIPSNQDADQDIPSELLEQVLKESSKKAVDESFALGLSILVEKEGKLVEIFPDGSEKLVESD